MSATYIIIIALLSLAVSLGIYLLSFVLRSKVTPKAVAFIHGPLAVAAIALLIVYSVKHHIADYTGAIAILGFTMLAGIALIVRDLRGKPLPKSLAVVHGILASYGFIFLILFIFAHEHLFRT